MILGLKNSNPIYKLRLFKKKKGAYLVRIFKHIARYLIFAGLMFLAIKYQDRITFLQQFNGINTELIGAFIVFLLIDIPLTVTKIKQEVLEQEKAQLIIDYSLSSILWDLLLLFFYYLLLPAKKNVENNIYLSEVEDELRKIKFDDFMPFYIVYHREKKKGQVNDGSTVISDVIVYDSQKAANEKYDLEKGYYVMKYENWCNFFICKEDEKENLSVSHLLKKLKEIGNRLDIFLTSYSRILSIEQIVEINKMLFKIYEIPSSSLNHLGYTYRVSGLLVDLLQLAKYYFEVNKLISIGYLGKDFGIDFSHKLSQFKLSRNKVQVYKREDIYK